MKKESTNNASSLMGQRVSMYIDGLFNQPSLLEYYYIKFRAKRRFRQKLNYDNMYANVIQVPFSSFYLVYFTTPMH